MNYFINIETSTDTCSVSLSNDSEVIDSRRSRCTKREVARVALLSVMAL